MKTGSQALYALSTAQDCWSVHNQKPVRKKLLIFGNKLENKVGDLALGGVNGLAISFTVEFD